jgi:formate-dependent nitrite reductase membrane component NrfD
MIQARPYEFMTRYTPQTEWIRGGGAFICIAFFTIELGGGTYIFSSLVGSLLGMVLGFLFAILGTLFFIVHLGRPVAAIRAFLKPRSSWISRGVLLISLFLILAFIAIILLFIVRSGGSIALLNGSAPFSLSAFSIITYIVAFFMTIYAGLAMNYVNGIPLWNTALLPILFTIAGFWGGAEIASGIAAVNGADARIANQVAYALLLALIFIIPLYLITVRYSSPTGGLSVKQIISGRHWRIFWIVVVVVGIVLPVCAALAHLVFNLEMPLVLLWLAILCGLTGDFTMRFLLMKNGYYAPLTPISDVPTSPI